MKIISRTPAIAAGGTKIEVSDVELHWDYASHGTTGYFVQMTVRIPISLEDMKKPIALDERLRKLCQATLLEVK